MDFASVSTLDNKDPNDCEVPFKVSPETSSDSMSWKMDRDELCICDVASCEFLD